MQRKRRPWPALGALGPMLLVGLAHAGDPPPINELAGVVVSGENGQPVAGVPVVMAHQARGYLWFDEQGPIAQAAHETLFGIFPVPNGRYACTTVTDGDGRFVLRNFAAPNEHWVIVAGDARQGYTLTTRLTPEDCASEPLKLELEPPGFIEYRSPKSRDGMNVYLGVGLSRDPDPSDAGATAETAETDLSERVGFRSPAMWSGSSGKIQRLGPLPGGQWYKVTGQGMSTTLPYTPILFQRRVQVAPGAEAELSLEPLEGATVHGRVTSSTDEALGKVNVMVETADGNLVGTVSDQDGKYALQGIPPGAHTLRLLRHARRTSPG